MIDVKQFREYVVDPALRNIGLYSRAASNLLVGTAVQESGLTYLKQLGGGPALGVYQIEPATHVDVLYNWVQHRPIYAWIMDEADDRSLITDLAYATTIARLIYYRRPEPLPEADDIDGLASYWKLWYNTPRGKGHAAEFALKYREFVR